MIDTSSDVSAPIDMAFVGYGDARTPFGGPHCRIRAGQAAAYDQDIG